jgi:hypothetical protein
MIWVITAMLWYDGITGPHYTEYKLKQFDTKTELVTKLADDHGAKEGKGLKTWAFYCENRQLEEV